MGDMLNMKSGNNVFIRRMLKLARESDSWSNEAKGFESCALTTVRAQVSIWADDMHRGEKLKGHDLNKWAKHVLKRVQDLDEVFREDEKLRKEDIK